MGILESLFGSEEDNSKKLIALWTHLKSMPPSQLKDIVKYKPTAPHGKLALLLLCRDGANSEILHDERLNALGLLNTMLRSDPILLGKGIAFEEIRTSLKKTLRLADPSGDY